MPLGLTSPAWQDGQGLGPPTLLGRQGVAEGWGWGTAGELTLVLEIQQDNSLHGGHSNRQGAVSQLHVHRHQAQGVLPAERPHGLRRAGSAQVVWRVPLDPGFTTWEGLQSPPVRWQLQWRPDEHPVRSSLPLCQQHPTATLPCPHETCPRLDPRTSERDLTRRCW